MQTHRSSFHRPLALRAPLFAAMVFATIPSGADDLVTVPLAPAALGMQAAGRIPDVGWEAAAISADGRHVAFGSTAQNLTSERRAGLFLRDLAEGSTTFVAETFAQVVSISANGNVVAFDSFDRTLMPEDTNGKSDVFVFRRETGTISRISVSASGGEANDASYRPAVSGDGKYVAFVSEARNLVPGNPLPGRVYLKHLATGAIELVAVSGDGTPANGSSYWPSVSCDARFVAFVSSATNLVPGTTASGSFAYVRDRIAGTTLRLDAAPSVPPNAPLESPSISCDGDVVLARSSATNLPSASPTGVFAWHRSSGTVVRVGEGFRWKLSADGATAAFSGSWPGADSAVAQAVATVGGAPQVASVDLANRPVYGIAHGVSGDGTKVLFEAHSGQIVAGDTNGAADLFVRDATTGDTTRVNLADASDGPLPAPASGDSFDVAMSERGDRVVFASAAENLVPDDLNGFVDVYLACDCEPGLRLISRGVGDAKANGWSSLPTISLDGRFVTFQSYASNLVSQDDNAAPDVFVYDVEQDNLTRIGIAGSVGQLSRGGSAPSISGDGGHVVFVSESPEILDPGAPSGRHVYVRNLASGSTNRISDTPNVFHGLFSPPVISSDGRFIAFNEWHDAGVRDRALGITMTIPLGRIDRLAISGDGRTVAVETRGFDFDPSTVSIYDVVDGSMRPAIPESVSPGRLSNPSLSSNGRLLAVAAGGTYLDADHIEVIDLATGAREVRGVIPRTPNARLFGPLALSPDGRRIVYQASAPGWPLPSGTPGGAAELFATSVDRISGDGFESP